jgi:uncharacterized membrane protein YraQ (UPF0718 family)
MNIMKEDGMNIGPEEIIRHFLKSLPKNLFLVFAGTVFAISLSAFITQEAVNELTSNIGDSLLVIYAALIGFVSPGPRYIIYPILLKLKDFGVHPAVIISLVSGHVLIEPSTAMMEAGFFGIKFPIKRFFVSLLIAIFAGMITLIVVNYFGWKIL